MSVGSADITRLANAIRDSGDQSYVTTFQVLQDASGYLLSEMEARVPVKTGALRNSLGVRVEGSRVIVGPTATYAEFVEFDTKPHEIRPKKQGGLLVFTVGGQKVFARKVNHPGTKAQPFVRPAFDAWVASLGKLAAEANIKKIREGMR